jgi:hypothetical protein
MSNPFQMLGLSGSRDERGLISLAIPWNCGTLSETLSIGGTFPFGLPEVGRAISQLDDGSYQVTINFQGIEDAEGQADSFEFDSSFREEPIESHPSIDQIKRQYGGNLNSDGRISFPEKLPGGSSGSGGLNGKRTGTGDKNPMFGVTTYLVLNAVFRHTYLRRTIPNDLLNRVGTTRSNLPEGFPTPPGRNWLVMPPKVGKRGNVYEISEEWMLSKPGQLWPEAIYGLIER